MGNAQSFSACCSGAASVDSQQVTVQQVAEAPEATPTETQKDAPAAAEDAKSVEAAEEVKEALQEPAQEAAQEPAKESVQEEAKEAKQEQAKEAEKEEEVKETAAAPVETSSLTITFELKGKTTEVKFEKRPLGFVFGAQKKGGCCSGGAETGKYVVTKVEKKGLKEVKVGMVIKKINDTEVPDKKEWVEFQEMMALAAKPLPEEEPATPAPVPTKPEDAPIEDVTAQAPEAAPAAPEQAPPEASPAATPEQAPEAAKATEPTAAPEVEPEAAKASEPEAAKAEPATEPAAAATA